MSAPLGYQMPGEPQVMTRGQARFTNLVQTSVPSRSGAFIGVDMDRDGGDAFLHVPEAMIYHLYFKGLGSERIVYSREDERAATLDYALADADVANLSGQTEFRARRVAGRAGAVEVTIPSITLEPNEVLAASPLLRTDHGLQRMTSLTARWRAAPRPGRSLSGGKRRGSPADGDFCRSDVIRLRNCKSMRSANAAAD